MGTRGTIHILDGEKTVLSIYSQWDSYPTELGKELKRLLATSKIVNGYSTGDACPNVFNGMGCLSAWLTGALKLIPYGVPSNPIGRIYITDKQDRQEYNYFLSSDNEGKILLTLKDCSNKILYKGLLLAFRPEEIES